MSRPWSYSRLSCYESCPQQFKYRYIEKLSGTKEKPAAERGQAIHAKAEQYLLGKIPMYPPELQKVAAHAMLLKQKGAGAEQKLAVKEDWSPAKWDDGDVYLRAILDINYTDGEVVHVQDWKTGKIYDSHKDQMSMYTAIIAAHYPAPTYHSRLIYIDQGLVTPPRVVEAPAVKGIRLMIDGRIKSAEADTIFPTRTGSHCRFCDYSRMHHNGPCPKG